VPQSELTSTSHTYGFLKNMWTKFFRAKKSNMNQTHVNALGFLATRDDILNRLNCEVVTKNVAMDEMKMLISTSQF
jgi:hypothetical protein